MSVPAHAPAANWGELSAVGGDSKGGAMTANKSCSEAEEQISEIVNSDVGAKYNIRNHVADLFEIPYSSFQELKQALVNGESNVYLAPVSTDSLTFNLMATPLQSFANTCSFLLAIASGIALLVLSVMFSWYLLILLPLCLVAFSYSKSFFGIIIWAAISALLATFAIQFDPLTSYLTVLPIVTASISGYFVRYTYQRAIFGAACSKEYAFAYLFSAGKITLRLPNGKFVYSGMEAHTRPD